MDSFEQLVAELLWVDGYWVQTSLKIDLSREEKHTIGRPTSPRWELDVVGYRADTNHLLVLECKSYLDSSGVRANDVIGDSSSTRYKLFRDTHLRKVVFNRLKKQMVAKGYAAKGVTVSLGLVAGNISKANEDKVRSEFSKQSIILWSPEDIVRKLSALSNESYENQISSVVAKILLRNRNK